MVFPTKDAVVIVPVKPVVASIINITGEPDNVENPSYIDVLSAYTFNALPANVPPVILDEKILTVVLLPPPEAASCIINSVVLQPNKLTVICWVYPPPVSPICILP